MQLSPGFSDTFARRLTGSTSPTADLYFAWPCADLLKDGVIRCLAPTVYLAGRTLIVIRHALGLQQSVSFDRLIYVIDDDWRAGLAGSGLPLAYRAKLALVEARAARHLEKLADTIVVSSPRLATRYRHIWPGKNVIQMSPAWPLPQSRPAKTSVRAIAYLGAWTHQRDFGLIAPALKLLLDRHPDVSFTLSANVNAGPFWANHPQTKIVPALPWNDYLAWLIEQRFDIGLYPLRDTGFNRARSVSKLFEYALCGAAVVASDSWEVARNGSLSDAVELVPETPDGWGASIERLLGDPAEVQARVSQTLDGLRQSHATQESRGVWRDILAI
ncbi:MAG: hypothetical protein KUG69_13090 [Marinosulfonomonas sp.]|nr:hypothetical protein [Marinosulfonomonas sp.]